MRMSPLSSFPEVYQSRSSRADAVHIHMMIFSHTLNVGLVILALAKLDLNKQAREEKDAS